MSETESSRPPLPSWFVRLLGAIQGVWLLTWKSRLSPRRLPLIIGLLLFLPVLTFFVTKLPAGPQVADAYWFFAMMLYFLEVIPLGCLIVCGAMIRDEIQNDTMGYLLTRPQSRASLFSGKYLSCMTWLQMVFLIESVLFLAVGYARGIPDLTRLIPLVLGVQILAVMAWSALGSLLGLLTKNYIVWGIVYGFIVELGIGRIPTNINILSLSVNLKTLLAQSAVFVDQFGWSEQGWVTALAILLAAPPALCLACMALFTWKEYLHSQEFQK